MISPIAWRPADMGENVGKVTRAEAMPVRRRTTAQKRKSRVER